MQASAPHLDNPEDAQQFSLDQLMGPLVGENTFIHCSGPRRAPWHGRSPRSNCAYERGPARGRGCRGSTGCEWVGQKDPASSIFGAVRGSISVGVACAER